MIKLKNKLTIFDLKTQKFPNVELYQYLKDIETKSAPKNKLKM